jgi:hypothetical protein
MKYEVDKSIFMTPDQVATIPPRNHRPDHTSGQCHENRSPFLLLNGVLLSYLLFTIGSCPSTDGPCLGGADSEAPLVAAIAMPPPIVAELNGLLGTLSEYSSDSTIDDFFRRCSSYFAVRSALILRLAK